MLEVVYLNDTIQFSLRGEHKFESLFPPLIVSHKRRKRI